MSLQKINIRNSVLIIMVIVAAITRSLNINHITQGVTFTPVGAIAMFAGAYFSDKWKAFLVPMVVVFISDLALNYAYFHKFVLVDSSSVVVYLSLFIMVIIGMNMKRINILTVTGASALAVLIHWLLVDLPFFYPAVSTGLSYSHDLAGYRLSLINAIPFERPLLLGTLIYGAILFGGFELAKRRFSILQTNSRIAV